MSNDIDSWIQSNLSANDYNKVSSVENVWLSNGNRYVRIPGSYVDAHKIYYKNGDGELFGIGDVSSDERTYSYNGSYTDYFSYAVLDSWEVDCVLYADKVENGVEKTVCILPSGNIDSNVYNTSGWSSIYTIDDGEITYNGELANCLSSIFIMGKVSLNINSLNVFPYGEYGRSYNLLYSWNLGEWNTEFEYADADTPDSISQILEPVSKISFTEVTTDYIPNLFNSVSEEDLEYYRDDENLSAYYDGYNYELASKFAPYFRTQDENERDEYVGYPVIGELKDTLDYALHKPDTQYRVNFAYGICPVAHQPMLLTNRVGNKVTIVHAPDIIAYSVIDFGDGSDPVVLYTNPKSYDTGLPSLNEFITSILHDIRSFEGILYRERDYRGEHTYRNNGTYVISADLYYFGTKIEPPSSSNQRLTRVFRIHATKTIVIDDAEQDLIYFKVPKEIPHLYINGYRCPVVSTDSNSNTVALNVTGYDFAAYAQMAYDLCEELTANVTYTNLEHIPIELAEDEEEDDSAFISHYGIYISLNILALTKYSFRVAVCERDDVRNLTIPLKHVCSNDRDPLINSDEFASMLDIFGESCAPVANESYSDKISLIGPQCIGRTYDLRNLMDWGHLYMNYYPELMVSAEEG